MPKSNMKKKTKAIPSAPVIAPPVLRRVDILTCCSLLLLQLIFWWPAAWLRGYMLISDSSYFFEPVKSYFHETLRAGHLALWTPYLYNGYPLAAEGQVAAYYPPSIFFSWLLPGGGAVNWLLIFHLMLAAAGMYLLARRLQLSPFAAWIAGATFSFSGYFFAHLQHVSLISAAAWLPWIILCIERAWSSTLLPNAALAALSWGAMALAGHPQTVFYASLAVLFWILWRTIQEWRIAKRWPLHKTLILTGVVFILGVGVAAVQLLLTQQLSATAPHGSRGSLAYITSFSLLSQHLWGLISPNWQGSPAFDNYRGERYFWEYVLYIGLLPLALALLGAMTRRGWTLAGLAVGALLLALAAGNPLYDILRTLPGFADFRAHARFIYLFTFAAALLAGIGGEELRRRWLHLGRREWMVMALVVVAVLGDLWHFDKPLSALTNPKWTTLPHPLVQTLESDRSWWRILVFGPTNMDAEWKPAGGWARNPDGWAEARMMLGADLPQAYHLRILRGYAGFIDPEHKIWLDNAYARALGSGGKDATLLSLLGTRYLAVPRDYSLPWMARAEVKPVFALYRNPAAFPRAFAVGSVITASSRAEARAKTIALADQNQLQTAAVVSEILGAFRPIPGAVTTITRIEELRPERIRITARATRDALLILNERWDPGWHAYLDGHEAPLVETDGILMGAPLPEGEHRVEFRYEPLGVTLGVPLTLLASAVCLWLIIVPALRSRRKLTTGVAA